MWAMAMGMAETIAIGTVTGFMVIDTAIGIHTGGMVATILGDIISSALG